MKDLSYSPEKKVKKVKKVKKAKPQVGRAVILSQQTSSTASGRQAKKLTVLVDEDYYRQLHVVVSKPFYKIYYWTKVIWAVICNLKYCIVYCTQFHSNSNFKKMLYSNKICPTRLIRIKFVRLDS